MEIPHWTFHDLRRTAATGMARLGIAVRVTEAVLNHVSGTGGGIVGVYQRHDYADEKRAGARGMGALRGAAGGGQAGQRGAAGGRPVTDGWGIPDWLDPASYGDTSQWNRNRWRWEFVRRRDDIRADFDAKAAAVYAEKLALYAELPDHFCFQPPRRPDEPGFWVSTRLIGGTLQKLPNPRIGDQPFYAIGFTDWPEKLTRFNAVKPPKGYLRVDFDLSMPIEPQLHEAKLALQEVQKIELGKVIQKRRRPEKWLTYLRILDGRAAGASWSTLTRILPSRNGTEQAARDAWQQADALRFNF